MCGNVQAPSIVGRSALITTRPLIGSILGPLKAGVKVRIDEEVELDANQRQQYEANNQGEAPDYFYRTTMTANPAGEDLEGVPVELRQNVVLFRDEFELID